MRVLDQEGDSPDDPEMAKHTPLGSNLLQLLREHDVSQNRLAEATGISQATISRIINSRHQATSTDTLIPIANFFGITVEKLRGQSVPHYQSVAAAIVNSGSGIAIYPLKIAGRTSEEPQRVEKDKLGQSLDFPALAGIDPVGRDFSYILAPDNSMFPLINQGDVLIIDLALKSISEGQIYAIAHQGKLMLRIANALVEGTVRLRSLNPERYPDIEIPPSGTTHTFIVGSAVIRTHRLI